MKYLGVLLLTLLSAPALAADTGSGDVLATGARMIVALLVVLGIILLLYALSRKGFGFLPSASRLVPGISPVPDGAA